MGVNVCGIDMQAHEASSARKLLYSQVLIGVLLLLLVTGPIVIWQMTLAGHIRHDDISKSVLDDILENSTVIQSIPGLKELDLPKIKEEFLSSTSKMNRDHYTSMLYGSSALMLVIPCFCFCFAHGAIRNGGYLRMTFISCFEGLCGCSSFLMCFLPLLLLTAVCSHMALKDDDTYLDCGSIVPWVQNAVTNGAVAFANQQQPPRFTNPAFLGVAAGQATLSIVWRHVLLASNVTSTASTSFLDAISKHMNTTRVDQVSQNWVFQFKASHLPPASVPLANVTENLFSYMFTQTTPEQMKFCETQKKSINHVVAWLAAVFSCLSALACCNTFTCCLGSWEARAARNAMRKSATLSVATNDEVASLLSSGLGPPPAGSLGPPPKKKEQGLLACCSTSWGKK